MRRKIGAILISAALLLALTAEFAAAVQKSWQYYKDLPSDPSGFALIRLDTEVIQNCQESFADIRITDRDGREIASQLIQPGREEIVHSVNLLNAAVFEDHTSAVIDMGVNPSPHNQLDLNIALDKGEDYLREVEVLASNDAISWGQVGTGKIFAYQNEQFNQISYPTSTMRYLQVNIKKRPGEGSLRITSAHLKFLTSHIYRGELLDTALVSNRSDQRSTTLVIDLGSANYMVSAVHFITPDRNFNRAVQVSSSQNTTVGPEDPLVVDRIIAYEWNNYLLNKDTVTVDQFCRRYLIVSILNEDSPPLDVQAIQVFGTTPYFIADLAAPGILWYGNPQALSPSYDLKQFAHLITKSDLNIVQPGNQQINPDYQPPIIPWTERHKWLLDAAVVLVAAGFVRLILRRYRLLGGQHKPE